MPMKTESQPAPSAGHSSRSVQGNRGDVTIINGNGNMIADGDVTIQGEQT
jgi:hypothetical protein